MAPDRDSTLQDEWGIDLAPLVPAIYAAYRPLIEEAIVFFLERLPTQRLTQMLADQQSLPAEASMSQRLATLLGQCPTLQKLGQVVARDRRLDPALRTRLQALEFMEPLTPLSVVEPIIRRELGDLSFSTMRLAAEPLAEASVAVVVPFSLPSAEPPGRREGVLKVLKPGVEQRLEEELEIWSALGIYIDERCEHHHLAPLHYAETLETVRGLLSNEIRLDREQEHLAAAAASYAECGSVQIPSVLPFCTPRITAMERVYGCKVTDADHLPEGTRRKLASAIIEALIAHPVWSADACAIFHADPHAGNLFCTNDERLAILDWSLVGRLGKTERIHTMQVMIGALSLDAPRVCRAIAALACARPKESALREVVDKAMDTLYADKLPGFRWLMGLMDNAMLKAGVRFSEDLLLFRKSVLTLEGVVADVSPKRTLDRVLPASAARQFLIEWTSRAFALPNCRDFGTHVSNLDLLWLYWSAPKGAARYWMNRLSGAGRRWGWRDPNGRNEGWDGRK